MANRDTKKESDEMMALRTFTSPRRKQPLLTGQDEELLRHRDGNKTG